MQEKKQDLKINQVIIAGSALIPAVLTADEIEKFIFTAAAGAISCLFLTCCIKVLSKWFRSFELGLLTLLMSGFLASISYIFLNIFNINELIFLLMAVSLTHQFAVTTNNFKEFKFFHGLISGAGYALFILGTGFIRQLMPSSYGYNMLAAAVIIFTAETLNKK